MSVTSQRDITISFQGFFVSWQINSRLNRFATSVTSLRSPEPRRLLVISVNKSQLPFLPLKGSFQNTWPEKGTPQIRSDHQVKGLRFPDPLSSRSGNLTRCPPLYWSISLFDPDITCLFAILARLLVQHSLYVVVFAPHLTHKWLIFLSLGQAGCRVSRRGRL